MNQFEQNQYYNFEFQMEQNRKRQKKILSDTGLSLFIMAVAILVSQVIFQIIIKLIDPEIFNKDWYGWVMTALCVVGVGLPVFYAAIGRVPKSESREVNSISVIQFIGIFFVCTGSMYLANFIGILLSIPFIFLRGGELINPVADAVLGSNFIITFIYGSFVAPFVEEIIFRKLLLDRLRRFGDLAAILLSGIAFGLFHMNLLQFLYASVLGFIFAYVTLKTNTIRYSIILHVLINMIGTVMAPLLLKSGDNFIYILPMILWIMTSITIGSLVFALNIGKVKFNKGTEMVTQKSIYFTNLGTLLFAVLCLAMIFITLLFG